MMDQVEVLYFDVFGTVVDYVDTITKALRKEIASTNIADTNVSQALQQSYDWRHFTLMWRQQYKLETKRLADIGNPEKITVDQMHMLALNRLISDLPLPPEAQDSRFVGGYAIEKLSEALDRAWTQEVRDRLNFAWHLLEPWPDSVAGLEALKSRFKIGTLTNGNVNLMVDMAKHAELPWDFLLTADLMGSFKPDPQMYRRAMQLFDVQPEFDGHRACMVAAHVSRSLKKLSFSRQDDADIAFCHPSAVRSRSCQGLRYDYGVCLLKGNRRSTARLRQTGVCRCGRIRPAGAGSTCLMKGGVSTSMSVTLMLIHLNLKLQSNVRRDQAPSRACSRPQQAPP